MLPFERRVVAELTTAQAPEHRRAVQDWVDACLADMPDVLRLGVAAESVAFGLCVALLRPRRLDGLLRWLDRSPIGVLQSYPRLFRSLVLFGELELEPEEAR